MELENQDIKCNFLRDAETVIKKAEVRIEKTRSSKERRYYAQDILLEAGTLLSCSKFNDRNPSCINCRSILRGYIQEYEYLAKDKKDEIQTYVQEKE